MRERLADTVALDGAALNSVAELGALNGDEGAICPNGCAEVGALPNAP
jgi:hypothetical protein